MKICLENATRISVEAHASLKRHSSEGARKTCEFNRLA
jgi:hypothetical protein